jgi:hypothetical protein
MSDAPALPDALAAKRSPAAVTGVLNATIAEPGWAMSAGSRAG